MQIIADNLILIINSLLLLLAIILSISLLRNGSKYTLNVGDSAVQTVLKWKILRALIILIVTGLTAAVFNLFFV